MYEDNFPDSYFNRKLFIIEHYESVLYQLNLNKFFWLVAFIKKKFIFQKVKTRFVSKAFNSYINLVLNIAYRCSNC